MPSAVILRGSTCRLQRSKQKFGSSAYVELGLMDAGASRIRIGGSWRVVAVCAVSGEPVTREVTDSVSPG